MARDLVSGETVYLGRNGDWTRDRDFALLIDDATTADLHLLDAEARAHEVMAPHLADAPDRRRVRAPGRGLPLIQIKA
jgi:hypothetical protein